MKILLAVLTLAASAAPASALVWQFSNESKYPVSIHAHDTQSKCEDYTRALTAKNGWTQMDWRGGCTGSCATWFQVSWTNAQGVNTCKRYNLNPLDLRDTCRSRRFHLIDSPDATYPFLVEFPYSVGSCE